MQAELVTTLWPNALWLSPLWMWSLTRTPGLKHGYRHHALSEVSFYSATTRFCLLTSLPLYQSEFIMNLKKVSTCIDESEGLVCHCRSRFFRVIGIVFFIFTNIIYCFKSMLSIQRCSFSFLVVEKMGTWKGSNKTWRNIVRLEWIGSLRVVQRGV